MKSAAAMIAPEFPAEIQPSALPSLQRRAQTAMEESGFDRTACAGCSVIAMTWVDGRLPQLVGVHLAETLHARDFGVLAELAQCLIPLGLRMTPHDLLALEDFVERWLRHVQVAPVDDVGEIAEEECQQQSANVASVHIGIGHGHDLVVAKLVDVEVVTDPGTHRGDEGGDLL